MGTKEQYQRQHVDFKLKIFNRSFKALMALMFGIVLYDSFQHDLPFYYVLFLIGGLMVGRIVSVGQWVYKRAGVDQYTFKITPIGLLLTLLLIVIRFFLGAVVLRYFNVVWIVDALYLLFIGIYYARWKNMARQIDERIYSLLRH